jgi:hypothetical protein
VIDLVHRILQVFARHHLWDAGVELIGSWCFHLYQRHLGVKDYPLKTQDIDFLIPYPFRGKEHIDLVKELEVLGFLHEFRPDGSLYLRNAEFKIEFIVPERGCGMTKGARIPSLGITALPLRFVSLLLEHPISVREHGVKVTLPNPAAFCLHKLMISTRRKRPDSRIKDVEQALHVAPIVRAGDLKRTYLKLPVPWRRRILHALELVPHDSPLLTTESQKLLHTLQNLPPASV